MAVDVGLAAGVEPGPRREGGPVGLDLDLVPGRVGHGGREPPDGDVSSPVRPSEVADRPGGAAGAGRPCRRGWSGGCARRTRPGWRGRRAAWGPWPPSHGRPGAVVLAGEDHDRGAVLHVGGPGSPGRSRTAPPSSKQRVTPPTVPGASWLRSRTLGEGAAGHDLVVAPAGGEGVELARGHAETGQVAAGLAVAGIAPAGEM